MVNFINSKAGTQRTPDGGLLPTAGRIDTLDQIIRDAQYAVTDDVIAALKVQLVLFI